MNDTNFPADVESPVEFEHKEPVDDDCGLPENPIFTDYAKYLWQGHGENRRLNGTSRAKQELNGKIRSK